MTDSYIMVIMRHIKFENGSRMMERCMYGAIKNSGSG